jgi:hypothetical protein
MAITHNDIYGMAERYAEAWCSHSVEAVVSVFEETGQTQVIGGNAIVGHAKTFAAVGRAR